MMTVQEILDQVKTLSPVDRHALIEKLLALYSIHDEIERTHNILEFEGMAAHLADDEDPQDYIDRLRDEWDQLR